MRNLGTLTPVDNEAWNVPAGKLKHINFAYYYLYLYIHITSYFCPFCPCFGLLMLFRGIFFWLCN